MNQLTSTPIRMPNIRPSWIEPPPNMHGEWWQVTSPPQSQNQIVKGLS